MTLTPGLPPRLKNDGIGGNNMKTLSPAKVNKNKGSSQISNNFSSRKDSQQISRLGG